LADFGQLSFRLLFGLGGSNVAAFSAPDPTTHAKELEKVLFDNIKISTKQTLFLTILLLIDAYHER
jgi:hypothetical protein